MTPALMLSFSGFLSVLLFRWWGRKKWSSDRGDIAVDIVLGVLVFFAALGILSSFSAFKGSIEVDLDKVGDGGKLLLALVALGFTLLGSVAIKISRDAVDDVRRIREEVEMRGDSYLEKMASRAELDYAAMRVYLASDAHIKRSDARYLLLSDPENPEALQGVQVWDALLFMYQAESPGAVLDRVRFIREYPQAIASITSQGWEYLTQLEFHLRKEYPQVADAVLGLLMMNDQ